MIKIFELHPDWIQKKGRGIISIQIRKTQYGNNRCFWLLREDGTSTDISYIKSIDGETPKLIEIKKACRSAILQIIQEFKYENTPTICPFTKEILDYKNSHVDHYDLTFNQLFNLWIKNQDIDDVYSKINESSDGVTSIFFTDDNLIKDFISFHNNNTHLRIVSIKANLSILKKDQL